jgi:hypothetical protein
MSYEQLLIPRNPSYRPDGAAIAELAQRIIDDGYVPGDLGTILMLLDD